MNCTDEHERMVFAKHGNLLPSMLVGIFRYDMMSNHNCKVRSDPSDISPEMNSRPSLIALFSILASLHQHQLLLS